jgi:periplasmic copper chaperone A
MSGLATSNCDGEGPEPDGQRVTSGCPRLFLIGSLLFALASTPCMAAEELRVSNARVPPSDQIGVDVPLSMTVHNDATDADALLRVRCPFVNFSERHTVDRGEGAPAMRAIKSIPIPGNKTTELNKDGHHLMLLQTRQKLVSGETLTCSITFQKAGTKETEVQVSQTP